MRSVALILCAAVVALDLNSYCKGFCSARYQDGFYSKELQRCGCVDYFIVNTTNRIQIPKRKSKDLEPPHVYYGSDEMKPAVIEREDPTPTAPMDF